MTISHVDACASLGVPLTSTWEELNEIQTARLQAVLDGLLVEIDSLLAEIDRLRAQRDALFAAMKETSRANGCRLESRHPRPRHDPQGPASFTFAAALLLFVGMDISRQRCVLEIYDGIRAGFDNVHDAFVQAVEDETLAIETERLLLERPEQKMQ